MITNKHVALTLVALAAGAGGFAGWKFYHAARTREAQVAVDAQHAMASARLAALEGRLAAEVKRGQEAESDNALLAGALKQAQTALAEKSARDTAPLTREGVMGRLSRAQLLARTGDPAEALRELMWCYNEGFPRLGGTVMNAGISSVISALGILGERYPEALAVLRARRDTLRQQVLDGPGGSDAVSEFAAVARALKDDPAMLEVFDRIAPGDPRRRALSIYAFEPLLTARRYGDAAEGRPYSTMISSFEIMTQERALPANVPNPERLREITRKSTVGAVAKNIEVLAGAGDLAHARTLADRLLAYDNTEATKALILTHATRAGRPDLLANPGP